MAEAMETQDFAFGFMLKILSGCEGLFSLLLSPPGGIWFKAVAEAVISGVFGNALVFTKAMDVATS
jgi:hypothetical protein